MTTTTKRTLRAAVLALGMGLAAGAGAEGFKKLPPDLALPASEGSPGPVTFSHESHVNYSGGCVACHPKTFRILEKGMTADGQPIRHELMEKGLQCGVCHGKTASGFESCDGCHKM
ncbi:MAG TPA: c(7)-type cytochrome triheme domain-containing protein [Anaeromyxobacteraceae bacterium]|nr:c(7)-type cytochrome triheme domain-containing protein [Anaeromyxobacteraceae bacterium]